MSIPQSPSPLSAILSALTYNAAWFSGATKEAQITAAIAAAGTDGAKYVFVPANMLPYNASAVTFNSNVRMIAEGYYTNTYNVRAYGAYGDGVNDDRVAIQRALDDCSVNGGGVVDMPLGTYQGTVVAHPQNNTYFSILVVHANTLLRGAGMGATVVRLAPNQTGEIILNFDISGGSDRQIHFQDFTFDGNNVNQSAIANVGIHLLRVRGVSFFRVKGRNVKGTGSSGPSEGFFFEAGLCSDIYYHLCVAESTAGSTSSGFSADQCTNISYSQCLAYGMVLTNGFTHNTCNQIKYTSCHSYLNGGHGFNSETSEDVSYSHCTGGGRGNVNATPWFTSNQSLGNTLYGFAIVGTTHWQIRNCVGRFNAQGVHVSAASSFGYVDGDYSNNTGIGIQVDPSVIGTTRIGHCITTGNSTSALEVPGGIGQTTIDTTTLLAPSVPGSTVALTNPYPMAVAVIISGGTMTVVNINGSAVNASSGTFILNPGWTITLTYSVVPGWLWSKVS